MAEKDSEPDVVVVEPEEEPFTHEPTEHRLLDVEYQHEPATAGLDYAGELVDEEAEPRGKKAAAKEAEPAQRSTARKS